ncbi:unnamed protein product [Sympodiomycopsis kandeliae]
MSSANTPNRPTSIHSNQSASNSTRVGHAAPAAKAPAQVEDKEKEPSLHGSEYADVGQSKVKLSKLLSMIIPAGIILLLAFWLSSIYLYGLVFRQGKYVSRVSVPVVDFDGGSMGEVLRQTTASMSGTDGYPRHELLDASSTTPEQLKEDVYKGKYWAALYVESGATQRWEVAINQTSPATPYDASNTLKYVLMNARYYTFYQQPFYSTSLTVTQTASARFTQQIAAPRLVSASGSSISSEQAAAYFNAIRPTEINANKAGDFAAIYDKVFFNTVGAVFPALIQFFFIMAVNGVSTGNKVYTQWSAGKIHALRHTLRIVWPLVATLASVGWTWAFKGSAYSLGGEWFLALWAVTFLYGSTSFNVLDILTAYIPMAFISPFVLLWIILNVAAAICSPQILHVWYRVNYFFPAHHWWELCIMVFTKGGLTHHLNYTLPVLLLWWIVSGAVAIVATRSRITKERKVAEEGSDGAH